MLLRFMAASASIHLQQIRRPCVRQTLYTQDAAVLKPAVLCQLQLLCGCFTLQLQHLQPHFLLPAECLQCAG